MVSYSSASVHSANPEEYVLKLHGQDVHDVFIQLKDFATMESWQACLNQDIMKQQQQMTKRLKISTISTTAFPSIYTSAEFQNQNLTQKSEIIEEDGKTSNNFDDVSSDITRYEYDLSTSSPSIRPCTGRRRSKSYPSTLSEYSSNDVELSQKHSLTNSVLALPPVASKDDESSASDIYPNIARREKRRTYSYDSIK